MRVGQRSGDAEDGQNPVRQADCGARGGALPVPLSPAQQQV